MIDLVQRDPRIRALKQWLRDFLPARAQTDKVERIRACFGALLGVLLTALTAYWLIGPSEYLPILIAPIGASAVLLFAVPGGPLAQPWAILGGNTVAALVGVTCLMFIDSMPLASAVAVGGTIGAMFVLRCLHPPGGAVALTTVLGGDYVLEQGYMFAFSPVALQTALLLIAGIIYNNATGRRYPNPQTAQPAPASHKTSDHSPGARLGFTEADLENVLQKYEHFIDISRSDLATLLRQTEMQAYRRQMGEITCGDIMSRDLVTVDYDTPLAHAWTRLQFHRIKALPVIDEHNHVIGMITLVDFLKQARLDHYEGMREKLVCFLKRNAGNGEGASMVGEIMTTRVDTARESDHIVTLVGTLSDGGRHHVPVVDGEDRLVGMVTQSDLVAALYRNVQAQQA